MYQLDVLVLATWICALFGTSCTTGTLPQLEARGPIQRGVTAALNRFVNLFTDGQTPEPCKCGVSSLSEEDATDIDGEERVVGGERSGRYEFPWHVGLVSTLGVLPFCGGSLISDRWVLTAAHCVAERRPARTLVVLRAHASISLRALRLPVASIAVHPSFAADTYSHDVALVELLVALPLDRFGGAVAPICLPEAGPPPAGVPGANGTTAGWGAFFVGSPPAMVLQKVTLPLMPTEQCNATLSGQIDSSMVCAGGSRFSGTCYGDSGGSLMTRNSEGRYQVSGVSSWARVCTLLGHPSVFANVTGMTDWIQYTTAGSRYCGA